MASKFILGSLLMSASSAALAKKSGAYEKKEVSELAEQEVVRKAICILESQPNEVAKGVINFTQAGAFSLCDI